MNILITNMTGFRNKGCEALTKVITSRIKDRLPQTNFSVFSNDPDYDKLWMPNKCSFYKTPLLFPKRSLRRWYYLIKRFLGKKDSSKTLFQHFKWAQVIISTGGDIFSSEYSGLMRHLYPIKVAMREGKPVVLLGHSIGPFKTADERRAFIQTMQHVPLITVRESLSLQYVRDMGLKNTQVELTADPAFSLPAVDKGYTDKLWKIYHLPYNQPIVAIAPSQGMASYAKVSYENHFESLKKLIAHLVDLNYHVLLIPHVRENCVGSDDRVICNRLYRELGFPESVTAISLDHSAEEIKGIIGRCDFMIAERMHAAIAALSQAIPTLVIGYSIKARGIMKDIFGTEKMKNYLIPIREVNAEKLKERFKQLQSQQDQTKEVLLKAMVIMKERAEHNFDLFVKLSGRL